MFHSLARSAAFLSLESGRCQVLSSHILGTNLPKCRPKLFFQLPLGHHELVACCLSSASRIFCALPPPDPSKSLTFTLSSNQC